MKIRMAQVEDAPAMGEVMVTTFLSAHRDQIAPGAWAKRQAEWTPAVSAQSWRRTIQELTSATDPQECIYVAEAESGELAGLILAYVHEDGARTGEVGAIYVSEHYQRRGIGRKLLRAVAAHLTALGVTAMRIGVVAANGPARRFYEAMGGVLVDTCEFEDEGFIDPGVVYGWADLRSLL